MIKTAETPKKQKKAHVIETDLYTGLKIFVLERQKVEDLEKIKESLSLMSNVEVDNSGFVRSVISFYTENPKELEKLKKHTSSQKGFSLYKDLISMILSGKSNEDIYELHGAGNDVVEKFRSVGLEELENIFNSL